MANSENTVFELFPTPILFCKRVLSQQQCEYLIHQFGSDPKQENNKNRDLSHTKILTPHLDSRLSRVSAAIHPHMDQMGMMLFGEKLTWSIKEMWINFLKEGASQAMHNHANAFISGVLYLTTTNASSQTVFMRGFGERGFVFKNSNQRSETGAFNAEKWIAPAPDVGDLILFPSHLLHEVPVNKGELRISLAFNAIPDRLDSWGYGISFSA
jgi:uncharacterized protein (TIGR02466 family)